MKTYLRITFVFILVVLLLVFSERHFLKRYLSYSGDPLTIPLSWYDPVENVSGQKDDDPPLYLTDDMITFVGFGGQRVWISPKNELVIVYATKKWSNAWNEAKLPNMILQSLQ